jgi:uncharacterized membrane protein (UPF0127 family)
MRKKFWFASIILLILVANVYFFNNRFPKVEISGQNLKVEVAATEGARELGLGGKNSLPVDRGMLFIFDKPGIYPFWMKDMKFSIDIIWLSDDWNVIYIKKYAQPESYPETFTSESSARYVLEVNAGFADKYDLRIGDQARIKLPL